MPANVPIQSLSERLSAELVSSFDPRATGPILGGEGLLLRFERFGTRIASADGTLADALAAALQALTSVYDRFGQ